jgi:hypothetical protein
MLKTILVTAALVSLASAVIAADGPDTATWVQFTSFTYTGRTTATPGAGDPTHKRPKTAESSPLTQRTSLR